MSYEISDYVMAHSEATGSAKLLLVIIANHADDAGVAWPSLKRLCRFSRLSERAVRKNLRQLELDGDLITLQNGAPFTGGDRRNNQYQIVVRPCGCPRNNGNWIRHVPPSEGGENEGR